MQQQIHILMNPTNTTYYIENEPEHGKSLKKLYKNNTHCAIKK